jgi:hypothetical protein
MRFTGALSSFPDVPRRSGCLTSRNKGGRRDTLSHVQRALGARETSGTVYDLYGRTITLPNIPKPS